MQASASIRSRATGRGLCGGLYNVDYMYGHQYQKG